MKKFLFVVALLSSFLIKAQDTSEQLSTKNWKTLETNVFAINYPSDWEVNQDGLMGTSFYLFSPVADENDLFRENINLIIQDISAYDITFDQFVELSEKQLVAMMQDTEILSSERVQEDNEYHNMVFTATQGAYKLKFQQHSWISGTNAYILTFTCDREAYELYSELGESIMKSLIIK